MKFTDSHEWVKWEADAVVLVGVTAFAQKELGEVVYVELPKVGKQVAAQQEIAVLESTKAAADIYSPVSGVVVEINSQLTTRPELINQQPEQEGWICKIRLSELAELNDLMDLTAYQILLNGA